MLGWILGAGAVGTLCALVWAAWERGGRIGAEKDLALMGAQAQDLGRQFREEQKARAEDAARFEAVIGRKNAELLEQDAQIRALAADVGVRPSAGDTAADGVIAVPGPNGAPSGGGVNV